MNDHAQSEREALIASTQPATEPELRLNQELAFERARADRLETVVREVLMTFPNSMPRLAIRQLETALRR